MQKIDWSNPERLKTRDGRRVLGSVQLETASRRLVVVMDHDGTEDFYSVDATSGGAADEYAVFEDADDILMRPKTITRFVAMYKGCPPPCVMWDSRAEAEKVVIETFKNRPLKYTIIPIEIEIPEGWE